MPPELMARLDRALDEERTRTEEPSPAPVAPRRSRWPRLVVAFTTGVVVLAGVSVGVATLWRSSETTNGGPEAAADRGSTAPELAAPDSTDKASGQSFGANGESDPASTGDTQVYHSGRDYSRTNLTEVGTQKSASVTVDSTLTRLATGDEALTSCFSAVELRYPGHVNIADFAYFEGAPALVLHVSQVDGSGRAVVVGANCGLSGADELYTIAA